MIRTEQLTINGKNFVKTYSDEGRDIIQNETGIVYIEAIDAEGAPYTYSEGKEMPELTAEEALEIILGGEGV